ncbi:phosphoribosylanthranilate isomerase [Sandaracinobacter sp. RS1-74]|uniref:phosphoribosylanthranilate isomerase n=1 Tax=Sandaracinobacteroides sayramensis TaxID=2913411 RepID=UPI001ED9D178|nr:phosphoribosylanthranilate isomerase [Sandaracinobacteroides sayramensis]MCG2839466.1 phosphoribosylanthranilate isomerase [Sandaracinobacteroides sayramensis]
MRTRVKICGITSPEALVATLSAGADACGFVFFPPSPRALTPEEARPLAARAPHLLKVGLFVDADDALIEAAVSAGALGALQLQGAEGPERVAALKARFGLPVWRAVGVKTAADVAEAARRFSAADLLLLDAKPPEGATLPGGNGLRFDWRILADARPSMAWGLAGGLTAESVGEAIARTGAPLVDVSSGVESAPGMKDIAKIAAFVEAARRA